MLLPICTFSSERLLSIRTFSSERFQRQLYQVNLCHLPTIDSDQNFKLGTVAASNWIRAKLHLPLPSFNMFSIFRGRDAFKISDSYRATCFISGSKPTPAPSCSRPRSEGQVKSVAVGEEGWWRDLIVVAQVHRPGNWLSLKMLRPAHPCFIHTQKQGNEG